MYTAAYLGLIINTQCSVAFPSLFKATRFGRSLLWTAFISSIYLFLSEVIERNLSIFKNEWLYNGAGIGLDYMAYM